MKRLVRALDDAREQNERLRVERNRLSKELEATSERLVRHREAVNEVAARQDVREYLTRPSFLATLRRSQRLRAAALERGAETDPVWRHNSKSAGYAVAARLGIRHPERFWRGHYREIPSARLPDRFVIKPISGTAARGVFPLVRSGEGRFLSLLDNNAELTLGQAMERLSALVEEGQVSETFLVEELIAPPGDPPRLPHDWKVYCFGGEAELVLQKDPMGSRSTSDARFKFYDPTWRDLGPVRVPDRVDSNLPTPWHPTEVVAVAERVAGELGRPFIRVDLYDHPERGVLFGEITPHPGGDQWYGHELDERMGQAWESALLDSWVRGTRTLDVGLIDTADP